MKKKITIASLNIEKHAHIERVKKFLDKHNFDVVCFQEVLRKDFLRFRKEYRMRGAFAPMVKGRFFEGSHAWDTSGVALLSRFPILNVRSEYYPGRRAHIVEFSKKDRTTVNHVLLTGEIKKDGERFVVGTTHFTWTPDGGADDLQRRNLKKLLAALKIFPEIILCGDFNAPRGGEIFSALAGRYTDNIPSRYATSIDPRLHRAGALRRMVDGLFTTPAYRASNVRLVKNVSDHCAIIARILRV